MARETRNYDIEVILKGLQNVEALKKDLDAATQSLTRFMRQWETAEKNLSRLNVAQAKNFPNLLARTRMGSPEAALRNSALRGEISEFQATTNQLFARLTNTFTKGMRDFTRAIENDVVRNLATRTQKIPSEDLGQLRQQIQAQQYRAAQAQRRVDLDPESAGPRRLLRRETRALDQLIAKEEELKRVESERLALSRRLAQIDEQLLANRRQMATALATEDKRRQLSLLIKRRELQVASEEVKARAGMDNMLARAQSRLQATAGIQRRITEQVERERAARKDPAFSVQRSIEGMQARRTNPAFLREQAQLGRVATQERLFGDGGAFLFKVQGQLMANYLIMNKMFELFNFGTQFVIDLDQAFHQLQAITGTTNREMEGLSETLLNVSEGTKFTAVEVAEAATILGQAGFSARQIEESIAGITTFATAVGSELKEAVDIVTSVLSVFEMTAGETNTVVDTMTAAINGSKLTVDKLTLGLQYAGEAAHQAGANFNELTAVVAAFANAGVRAGSTLGTGLRQILIAFSAPTEQLKEQLSAVGLSVEDVNIRTQGLIGVFNNLKEAGFTASNAFKGLEVRAASAFLSVAGQLETAEQLQVSFELSEAAAKAHEVQMESLANTFDVFRSNLGVTITNLSGPFKEALQNATEIASGFLSILNRGGGALSVFGTALIGLGIATVSNRLATLVTNLFAAEGRVTRLTASFRRARIEGRLLQTVLGTMGGGFNLLFTAITTGITLLALFGDRANKLADVIDKVTTKVNESESAYQRQAEVLTMIEDRLAELHNRYEALSEDNAMLASEIRRSITDFSKFGLEIDEQTNSVDALTTAFRDLRGELQELANVNLRKTVINQMEGAQQILAELRRAQEGQTRARVLYDTLGSVVAQQVGVRPKLEGVESTARFGVLTVEDLDLSQVRSPELKQIFSTFMQPALEESADLEDVQQRFRQIGSAISAINRIRNDIENGQSILGNATADRQLVEKLGDIEKSLNTSHGQVAQVYELLLQARQNQENLEASTRVEESGVADAAHALIAEMQQMNSRMSEQMKGRGADTLVDQLRIRDQTRAELEDTRSRYEQLKTESGLETEMSAAGLDAAFAKAANQIEERIATLDEQINTTLSTLADRKIQNLRSRLQLLEARIRPEATVEELEATQNEMLAVHDELAKHTLDNLRRELRESGVDADPAVFRQSVSIVAQELDNQREQITQRVKQAIEGVYEALKDYEETIDRFAKDISLIGRDASRRLKEVTQPLRDTKQTLSVMKNAEFKSLYSDVDRRVVEERLIDQEKEAATATIGVLEDQSARLTATKDKITNLVSELEVKLGTLTEQRAKYLSQTDDVISQVKAEELNEDIQRLERQLQSLGERSDDVTSKIEDTKQALAEAREREATLLGNIEYTPLGFYDTLSTGLQQYLDDLDAAGSATVRIGNQLQGLFGNMTKSWQTFVTEAVTGTESIGGAMRNMALSIIDSMLQIASAEVATGFWGLLRGGFGAVGGTGSGEGAAAASGFSLGGIFSDIGSGLGFKNGGMVRAMSGRHISGRDNIPILAEPGEYVLRKSAVDMVGRESLDKLNAMGNRVASQGAAAYRPSNDNGGGGVVNVYVVSPDQKPTLGPNDVVAIIDDTIIRGGSTRKLIKQVKMGGL